MTLPIIGAALNNADLARYRDWVMEKDRDVELQSFDLARVLDDDWSPLAKEVKRLLAGHRGRLGIHGPFWGFTIESPDPLVQQVVRKRLNQGLDVCAAVGGTHMVLHSPVTFWDYNNLGMTSQDRPDRIQRVHDLLTPILRRAETLGVTLVMENIEDIDPRDRREIVESFGSQSLQLSIDTGHAHYCHRTFGAPPVDYFVRDAGALLAHVHLQDADGHADRHWAIGEGNILWPSVFAAIAALPQKPRLVLELNNKDGIPGSMAWLSRMGLGQ